jgi:hypothetical protein
LLWIFFFFFVSVMDVYVFFVRPGPSPKQK